MADKKAWIKAILWALILFVVFGIFAYQAQADPWVLKWEHTMSDIADPEKSGYRVYESLDNWATKILLDTVPITERTYSFERDSILLSCFAVTAFNQFGESEQSVSVCAERETPPSNLELLLQQIISKLDTIIEKLS